jgi:hypothetical protein
VIDSRLWHIASNGAYARFQTTPPHVNDHRLTEWRIVLTADQPLEVAPHKPARGLP